MVSNLHPTDATLAVIVAVYKVEPYLRACIESILTQSYRALWVILVDDGSPDSCGAICEEYAAVDPRVHVIHKENGGLSDARNAGLALVGDCPYVTFVDSDDWLEEGIYEACISTLERHPELDLVGYGHRRVSPEQVEEVIPEARTYSHEEALQHYVSMTSPIVAPPVWAKVYRRELVEGLKFFKGHKWEDVPYTLEVLWRSRAYALLPRVGVNYRIQRPGAITDVTIPDRETLFEDLEVLIQRYNDMTFTALANTLAVNCLWRHMKLLVKSPGAYAEHGEKYLKIAQQLSQRPYLNTFRSRSRWWKYRLFHRMPSAFLGVQSFLYRITHR